MKTLAYIADAINSRTKITPRRFKTDLSLKTVSININEDGTVDFCGKSYQVSVPKGVKSIIGGVIQGNRIFPAGMSDQSGSLVVDEVTWNPVIDMTTGLAMVSPKVS